MYVLLIASAINFLFTVMCAIYVELLAGQIFENTIGEMYYV